MDSFDAYESEPRRYSAPYAALSKNSRGRKFPIPRNPYRTDYQRDRDRIIHSAAFRRLQHKTQVFANLGVESDHYRTRLTHTIEVAQISRTIARALGLNEDLAEAVALAHDLGHTPFGHCGEDVLAELMADRGGFNHNQQSLRVVEYLEKRYPGHFGLNLTYELREAIIKHETDTELDIPEEFDTGENPLLEGQLVNIADEIAYNGHDIDDGLSSGLLNLNMLRESEFLNGMLDQAEVDLEEKRPELIRSSIVRRLVNDMVIDLNEEVIRCLKDNGIETTEDVRQSTKALVGFSPEQARFNRSLKDFLQEYMYRHPSQNLMRETSERIITFLFKHYLETIDDIPEQFRDRYPGQNRPRLVTDYIAGMTDRFALFEFNRLHKN
ncbi:MAG: deoxyguanosinetriphosphate triphosphohydrolase [FCB group bacterium]|nr:deoxyguanosinetriphosphate triphosphohydrolase [FCB group bacterium]